MLKMSAVISEPYACYYNSVLCIAVIQWETTQIKRENTYKNIKLEDRPCNKAFCIMFLPYLEDITFSCFLFAHIIPADV